MRSLIKKLVADRQAKQLAKERTERFKAIMKVANDFYYNK